MYSDFLEFFLVFIFYLFLHGIYKFFHFVAEIAHLFFESSHFLDLFEVINLHNIFFIVIKQVHFGIQFFLLFLELFELFLLFHFEILKEFSLVLSSSELLITVSYFLSFSFINEDIIKISKIWEVSNEMSLVLSVSFSFFDGKGIAINVEDLKIFKSCLFFC